MHQEPIDGNGQKARFLTTYMCQPHFDPSVLQILLDPCPFRKLKFWPTCLSKMDFFSLLFICKLLGLNTT